MSAEIYLEWLAAYVADGIDPADNHAGWDQRLRTDRAKAGNHDQLAKTREHWLGEFAVQRAHAARLEADGWVDLEAAGLLPAAEGPLSAGELTDGSARIRLGFRLLQPLLTGDDDPFPLFENALRKDRVFRVPHLSAASIDGLAADAYQRAFPPATWPTPCEWSRLGKDDPSRTRAYRLLDGHAARLFGVASEDDPLSAELDAKSAVGRIQFEPVWFNAVEFLVMNPQNEQTGCGTVPINFEAAAAGQTASVGMTYHNRGPAGTCDEKTVRADLARLVWALAHWWPVLGLGQKRLASYGAIEITDAQIEGIGWRGRVAGEVFERTWQGDAAWLSLAEWLDEGT